MFHGIITALATPFYKGEVDYESLKKLVQDQLDQGVDGLVVHGTTAESPTTTEDEKEKILEFVAGEVAGQVPIIVGVGSNSTQKTIETIKKNRVGQGFLVVVPYYNKPPQRGLLGHFQACAEATSLPLILYNVPGRTITTLEVETISRLSQVSNIVGIKEASGDLSFGQQVLQIPKPFTVLSGDDGTFMELSKLGGEGTISVASHLIGKEMKSLFLRLKEGETSVTEDYKKYMNLIESIYVESNPIPIKYALYKKGVIRSPEMRLPLVALEESLRPRVDQAMKEIL